MKIKLLNEIIGNWTFTQEDKEMYEYFLNIEINDKNKTKNSCCCLKAWLPVHHWSIPPSYVFGTDLFLPVRLLHAKMH